MAKTKDTDPEYERLRDTMYYYFDKGITDKFLYWNKEAMDYSLSKNNLSNYYNAWYNLIIFNLNESNIFQAYKQALAMSHDMRERKSDKYRYMATGALGLIYADCNNLEGARQCFMETISQLKQLKLSNELGPLYMDLAYVTIDTHPEEALKWANEAVRMSDDLYTQCDATAFRGMMEFKQKNTAAFLNNYQHYKELEKKGYTSIYGKFIEIYYACYQRDFDKARRLAEGITSPLDRYEYLRSVYDYQGDIKHAYQVLREQMAANDSINSTILTDNLQGISNELEMAETQQREARQLMMIAQAQQSESRHRIIALSVIAAAALLMIVALVYIMHNRRKFTRRLEQGHQQLLEAYDQLEETTMAKERIESELRIARDIQMSMVPHDFPTRLGLDLYASMTPAREVGGDLYDYILQDDKLYFCVGDVSGKGVPASLFMAQSIRLFRALAKQHQMPAQIVSRLNAELSENNDSGMFITMFIGLVDLHNGHLDFCNAGHNPPVIGGDDEHGSFISVEPNAPIGLWPQLDFVGEEIDTIKGRPLFVYTDGLNEAENDRQQQFGDERMLTILRQTYFENARQVIEHLNKEVEVHRNGAEPNDDLTMLCLRIS